MARQGSTTAHTQLPLKGRPNHVHVAVPHKAVPQTSRGSPQGTDNPCLPGRPVCVHMLVMAHGSTTTCTRLDGCPAGHTTPGSLHRSPNPAPSGFIHVSRNLSPLVVLSRCVCTVHCPSPHVTPACVAPLVSTVHVLATVQGSLTVHAQTARTHHSAQRVFSTRRTVTVCA